MSDDLGRGQVGWDPDQWQELDTLAADTVGGQVVLRNVVDHHEAPAVFSVRMAGKNVDVGTIPSANFKFDMVEEDIEDLQRKVRDKAQELAKKEDIEVLKVMQAFIVNHAINFDAFSKARAELGKAGVLQGFAVVVSPPALSELEIEVKGLRSGLELVELSLSTKVLQSNALPFERVQAIVVQASPAAYRLVHAASPRVRVLELIHGKKLKFQIEEQIAVAELEPNRCVFIEPSKQRDSRADQTPNRDPTTRS